MLENVAICDVLHPANYGLATHQKQEAQGWGKAVVETLAGDLQAEFPGRNRFSAQNHWLMRQLYRAYNDLPKLQPVIRGMSWAKNLVILSIPWGHNLAILTKRKQHQVQQETVTMKTSAIEFSEFKRQKGASC
jgi:hypothetical protein